MSQIFCRTTLLILTLVVADVANAQVIWDRAQIDQTRQHKPADDTPAGIAMGNLRKLADEAVSKTPYSVTHKKIVPPSGDKHDYLSYSRYWWPDPEKADGLPYIRKDGVVNRELIANGDRNRLGDFCNDVQALALAGYLFEEPRYTKQASTLVRTWFLDEATRMNPNLNFGQGVPGRADGRGPGIIDTRGFMLVLDAVELFDEANWSAKDQRGLQKWFDDYQTWLVESPLGQHEQKAVNNHGSWFAAQRARYALFAGRKDIAKQIVQDAKKRISEQFDAQGNQAAELKRTLSLHYSVFNITALSRLACVGDQLGENLWEHEPQHGCGIKKGLDGLLPYLTGDSKWEHEQLKPFSLSSSSHLTLTLFTRHFSDDKYSAIAEGMEIRHAERDFSSIVSGPVPVLAK